MKKFVQERLQSSSEPILLPIKDSELNKFLDMIELDHDILAGKLSIVGGKAIFTTNVGEKFDYISVLSSALRLLTPKSITKCSSSAPDAGKPLNMFFRALVNFTLLLDTSEFPSLSMLYECAEPILSHLKQLCLGYIAWMDVKSSAASEDTVAENVVNLCSILASLLRREFDSEKKPFCNILRTDSNLLFKWTDQMTVIMDVRLGNDKELRTDLPQSIVECLNAVLSENVVGEDTCDKLILVIATHANLKGVLTAMQQRVRKREPENLYFLRMLLETDEFGTRLAVTDFGDLRRKYFEIMLTTVKTVLDRQEFEGEGAMDALHVLVLLAQHDELRPSLLRNHKAILLAIVETIMKICDQYAVPQSDVEEDEMDLLQQISALFLRFYASMHAGGPEFAQTMSDHFPGVRGREKLLLHLRLLQSLPLLSNNSHVEKDDEKGLALLVDAIQAADDRGVVKHASAPAGPKPKKQRSSVASEKAGPKKPKAAATPSRAPTTTASAVRKRDLSSLATSTAPVGAREEPAAKRIAGPSDAGIKDAVAQLGQQYIQELAAEGSIIDTASATFTNSTLHLVRQAEAMRIRTMESENSSLSTNLASLHSDNANALKRKHATLKETVEMEHKKLTKAFQDQQLQLTEQIADLHQRLADSHVEYARSIRQLSQRYRRELLRVHKTQATMAVESAEALIRTVGGSNPAAVAGQSTEH